MPMTGKTSAHREPAWHGLKKTAQSGREFFGGGSSMQTRLKYWLPRVIIIGFAASMPFSASEFIANMDESEFIVWVLRLIWVFSFPLVFCLFLFLTLWVGKIKRRKKG